MTSIGFDTLGASKRLREAGMDERAAEAVVEIMQQTTMLPDISELATKTELLAVQAELKTDIALMEGRLRADLSEKIRMQGWAILGGMAVLLAFYTAMGKLVH